MFSHSDGTLYDGHMENGKRHGRGRETYSNGDDYVGQYKDDMKHGSGKYTFANGTVWHDGEWENDEPVRKNVTSKATLVFTDVFGRNFLYKGDLESGIPNGQGTATYEKHPCEGDKYVGDFKNGMKNGYGQTTFGDGAKYEGAYKDDLMSGYGKYTFADGTVWHIGMWKNNEPVAEEAKPKERGSGKFVDSEGHDYEYEGEMENGKPNGKGKAVYSIGDTLRWGLQGRVASRERQTLILGW